MSLNRILMTTALVAGGLSIANAQEKTKPEQTEVYTPVPKVVEAKGVFTPPPSDAVVLFDGKDLSKWVMTDDRDKPASWTVAKNILTVNKKGGGNIETKQSFGNYQLHIEWQVPANIEGKGQGRGNSGVFLASIGKGDAGYELQVLDSYKNDTYTNGQAGSIYKQLVPLANPTNKPGEWNSYDVIWTAPTFNDDKSVKTPAKVTVIFNGVVVQDNATLLGPTQYIGDPAYRQPHGPAPIKLQSHGDPSAPLSFRNIWVREL
jgi:hypothetical protein